MFLQIYNLSTRMSYLVKQHAPPAIYLSLEFRNTFFPINISLIIQYFDFVMITYILNVHVCKMKFIIVTEK